MESTLPQIEFKSISFTGGVSYEVYLWHIALYCLIKLIVDTNNTIIHHSYLTMFLFLIFVESIAVLLYKYLEKPINKLVRNRLDF